MKKRIGGYGGKNGCERRKEGLLREKE